MKFVSTPFGRVEVHRTLDKGEYRVSDAAEGKFKRHFGHIRLYRLSGQLLVWNANFHFKEENALEALLARYTVESLDEKLCGFCESKLLDFPVAIPEGPCTCKGFSPAEERAYREKVVSDRDKGKQAFYQP